MEMCAQTSINARLMTMPGTMPAMNSLAMDVLVTTPNMMKNTLGGMIGPTMDDASVIPVLYRKSYPLSVMDLISIGPSAAQSAAAAPEMPAKTMEHRQLTWASPPGQCPTQALAKLKIWSATPQTPMMLPAIMKKKMDRRFQDMEPSMTPCAIRYSGKSPSQQPTATEVPMATMTGALRNNIMISVEISPTDTIYRFPPSGAGPDSSILSTAMRCRLYRPFQMTAKLSR